VRLFGALPPLECDDLRLREDLAFLRDFGLERFQPLPHRLKIVALPRHPDARLRNRDALLRQLDRDPELAPRRLVDRHPDDRGFDPWLDAILVIRAATADLLQCLFTAALVQLLEAIEAVAAVAHHAARVRHVSELLRQFQQPHLRLDDFCAVVTLGLLYGDPLL
jgi:hypothetical protein